ncbi:uncharacterized protein LOC110266910 [Arachis ipaensis]|uniref:uncharacterized protein LOC110266910 n=1 Tax=Arachis ipaensis TaxID=130454 RepID=UPI000A2B88E3|nr:uncharacterized protein LOC110266910 [Arachis ipaensis]
MANYNPFIVVIVYPNCRMSNGDNEVTFEYQDPILFRTQRVETLSDLKSFILSKFGGTQAREIGRVGYRLLAPMGNGVFRFRLFQLQEDEHVRLMFDIHGRMIVEQFPEVRTPELLAKLIDVVSSSGGSNRNTTNVATAAGSSSRAAVASSSVPVYEPAVQLFASPSFAVDLKDGVGDEVGSFDILPNALQGVPSVGVGDGVLGDADEDDVEPDTIEDDSGDEVGATGPALAGGGSSSGTQQYLPHFSSLDLDAMRHEGGFRARCWIRS